MSQPETRVTKQRLAVTEALSEVDDFATAQQLHRWLQDSEKKVSLATVYRLLQSMADDGLVDVLRSGDGEARFRQCVTEVHHHHLVCRSCSKTVEVLAPAVERWAARVAAEHDFSDPEHTVEIYGLCADCRAKVETGSSSAK
ncbi:Fur family transcriptional regulator [Glutamicibacter mysorens]